MKTRATSIFFCLFSLDFSRTSSPPTFHLSLSLTPLPLLFCFSIFFSAGALAKQRETRRFRFFHLSHPSSVALRRRKVRDLARRGHFRGTAEEKSGAKINHARPSKTSPRGEMMGSTILRTRVTPLQAPLSRPSSDTGAFAASHLH